MELHAVEFLQQVIRKLDVGLVDLVDQQHGQGGGGEGFPQLAAPDVIGDVVNALVAQLAVAKAGDGVIFVKALLRLGGGLDVPFDQRRADGGRDLMRKHRLAGRSEEHTSDLQSLMRISYAVFCLEQKKLQYKLHTNPP